jgi:hypothetical protein
MRPKLLTVALAATVFACARPNGPAALLEETVTATLRMDTLFTVLGRPSDDRMLTEYSPAVREVMYSRFGLAARFTGRQLLLIKVSRRWDNTLFGLRVGDARSTLDQSRFRRSNVMNAMELTGRPGWHVVFDRADSNRISEIAFFNDRAPTYFQVR